MLSKTLPRHSIFTWAGSVLFSIALAAPAFSQSAAAPADIFRRLAADTWVARDVSFQELGFNGPVVLGSPDNRREIYLPVPAGVPLAEATLRFEANYIRANGGRTSMVLSLDGYPVMAKAFNEEKGDTSTSLGIDGSPRANGFVRFGVNWTTAIAVEAPCADSRTPGNILRIEPATRFSYRYDGAQVRDLKTAWGSLPHNPTILVAADKLSKESYDSAWRIGVTVERMGRRVQVLTLPAVGKSVDLRRVTVPPALKSIPAFTAIAGGGHYIIKEPAEVGAILALGAAGPLKADIIVADKNMADAMAAAFAALGEQIRKSAPEATAAFGQWEQRALVGLMNVPQSKGVKVANVLGRPAILAAPDAGERMAHLFNDAWRQITLSEDLVMQDAAIPQGDVPAISLKALGALPGSFDVLARGEWMANFRLGAVSINGQLPNEVVLDVSAAPSPARTPPVASVFLNDVLLASKNLDANGKRERITAPVPRYALGPSNVLRVSFVRQLVSDRCLEAPEAFPVSVLPSSHITLKKATPDDNFSGMFSRFSGGANIMLPAAYLADPQSTLPTVIRLAESTGVSPANSRLVIVPKDGKIRSDSAFLALDVPLDGAKSKLRMDEKRVFLSDGSDRKLFDLQGLDNVGVMEVSRMSGQAGIVYRSVGAHPPVIEKSFPLGLGNVAAVGGGGLLTEVDTEDMSGQSLIADAEDSLTSHQFWAAVSMGLVILFIALLWVASRARRRAGAQGGKH